MARKTNESRGVASGPNSSAGTFVLDAPANSSPPLLRGSEEHARPVHLLPR